MRRIDLEKIKRIREERGLSIMEVSKRLGFKTYQGYYKLESGIRNFKAEYLINLSEILGVKVEELIKEDLKDEG
ncbi:MAG: helix-turn-helix domain-containing protein [Dictyoglomus sp.]|uniref:helix-turn-helix domain-containing protein n=1 Tax=Dictyoglomus sp. TaxID=28205 RepID=UPI003D11A17C